MCLIVFESYPWQDGYHSPFVSLLFLSQCSFDAAHVLLDPGHSFTSSFGFINRQQSATQQCPFPALSQRKLEASREHEQIYVDTHH